MLSIHNLREEYVTQTFNSHTSLNSKVLQMVSRVSTVGSLWCSPEVSYPCGVESLTLFQNLIFVTCCILGETPVRGAWPLQVTLAVVNSLLLSFPSVFICGTLYL